MPLCLVSMIILLLTAFYIPSFIVYNPLPCIIRNLLLQLRCAGKKWIFISLSNVSVYNTQSVLQLKYAGGKVRIIHGERRYILEF